MYCKLLVWLISYLKSLGEQQVMTYTVATYTLPVFLFWLQFWGALITVFFFLIILIEGHIKVTSSVSMLANSKSHRLQCLAWQYHHQMSYPLADMVRLRKPWHNHHILNLWHLSGRARRGYQQLGRFQARSSQLAQLTRYSGLSSGTDQGSRSNFSSKSCDGVNAS